MRVYPFDGFGSVVYVGGEFWYMDDLNVYAICPYYCSLWYNLYLEWAFSR